VPSLTASHRNSPTCQFLRTSQSFLPFFPSLIASFSSHLIYVSCCAHSDEFATLTEFERLPPPCLTSWSTLQIALFCPFFLGHKRPNLKCLNYMACLSVTGTAGPALFIYIYLYCKTHTASQGSQRNNPLSQQVSLSHSRSGHAQWKQTNRAYTTKHITESATPVQTCSGPAQARLQGRLWAHAAPHGNETHSPERARRYCRDTAGSCPCITLC
jgi:hypothetical protein